MSDSSDAAQVSSDDKLWALLCYVLFPPLVPIIIMLFMPDKKNRPFLRYHYMNALVWGLLLLILSFLIVGMCLAPVALVVSIYFGIQAYQGKYLKIPWLTDFIKGQGWL
jgi:uncharacterized membrane protein